MSKTFCKILEISVHHSICSSFWFPVMPYFSKIRHASSKLVHAVFSFNHFLPAYLSRSPSQRLESNFPPSFPIIHEDAGLNKLSINFWRKKRWFFASFIWAPRAGSGNLRFQIIVRAVLSSSFHHIQRTLSCGSTGIKTFVWAFGVTAGSYRRTGAVIESRASAAATVSLPSVWVAVCVEEAPK